MIIMFSGKLWHERVVQKTPAKMCENGPSRCGVRTEFQVGSLQVHDFSAVLHSRESQRTSDR